MAEIPENKKQCCHIAKIIVLDNGEIVAIGNHEELIKECDIYRSIAISQLGEEVVSNV